MSTVLVIDDNLAVQTALEVLLSLHDFEVAVASTPDEGLRRLEQGDVGVVVQDMNFEDDKTSGTEGRQLFRSIRAVDPEMPVILLTAWTHLEQAVELVRDGAADYLEKPWDDDKLVTSIRNLLELGNARRERRRLLAERRHHREVLADAFDLCGLVYASEAIDELVATATRIAATDVPVLISGPSGSGKEKLADIVQANSQRRDHPYLKVNLGALPGELLESELFGVEAGAFTGANRSRPGRFEAADGGTLFLDELGELPLSGQVKLLRVLQTGDLQRLGSTTTRRVDVRIVSATNANLAAAVTAGSFREDLYYRLNVIELRVPPLQSRTEDILPLVRHFLRDPFELTAAAERALERYAWPGNVRELSNRLQRAMLLADDPCIGVDQLDLDPSVPPRRSPGEPSRDEIIDALDISDWVISVAARRLGLTRQALYRRLEKHGIDRETG